MNTIYHYAIPLKCFHLRDINKTPLCDLYINEVNVTIFPPPTSLPDPKMMSQVQQWILTFWSLVTQWPLTSTNNSIAHVLNITHIDTRFAKQQTFGY